MTQSEPVLFETIIEKLVTGGAGLGRCNGLAAFIPLTAPGERIRARIVRRKRGFVESELVEVLDPSPSRRDPPCPHFSNCGGCDWQHLTVTAQRLAKAEIVSECFRRLAGLEVGELLTGPGSGEAASQVADPAGCGPEFGYRNRIRLFAGPTGQYGLMRRGTNDVVPLETCLQMPAAFTAEILPWLRTLPPMEQVVVRMDGQNHFLVSLFGPPPRIRVLKRILRDLPEGEPPLAGCAGLLFNGLPIWGRNYLVLEVAGKKYRVGAQSFFQANLAETRAILETTASWLDDIPEPGTWLADLYCGVGLFTLALAGRFARVLAVDSSLPSIRDARNNVERDKDARGKVSIRQEPIARTLTDPEVASQWPWADACVVLDPPRQGLGVKDVTVLCTLGPRHVVYLSCDPATLARDTRAFLQGNYSIRRLRVFDMFPQTSHIETLLLLSRA